MTVNQKHSIFFRILWTIFSADNKDTSNYCHERFKCEVNGVQKPECTKEYMRISNTDQ